MQEGGGEELEGLIEVFAEGEVDEGGREGYFNGSVEGVGEADVSERGLRGDKGERVDGGEAFRGAVAPGPCVTVEREVARHLFSGQRKEGIDGRRKGLGLI